MKQLKLLCLLGLIMIVALSGCSGSGEDAALIEEAASESADFGNIVSASGKVLPVRRAELGFERGGRIKTIIEEGAEVEAGEILAVVEASDLEQGVIQAKAALAAVEANLSLARSAARSEDVAAAEGLVAQAEGRVAAAKSALAEAKKEKSANIKSAEAGLAEAEANHEAALAAVSRAQAEVGRLQAGPRDEEIQMYQYRINQAQSEFLISENLHFENFIDKEIGGGGEERARYQRESARNARDAIQAELNLLKAGASDQEVAAEATNIRVAQAQAAMAEAGVQAAKIALDREKIASAEKGAEAQVQIAEGELQQAQAELARLRNGSTSQEIAVLEAEVEKAAAFLSQAESTLENSVVRAPFAGTVGNVHYHAGELASPGVPVLALGDATSLWIETTDLNEVDAAQIGLDSPVMLTFDAFPGEVREGNIVRLSPMASAGQGGTNFTAVIEIAEPPEDLRWGMTAFVDIEV